MQPTLLVTGLSGHLARAAMDHLLARPHGRLLGTSRTPAAVQDLAPLGVEVRRADFDQPDGLSSAFQGAERVLLVSTGMEHGGPRRVQQHRHAIDALQTAGVQHVAYTSLQQADQPALGPLVADHAATETMLAASGLQATVLRHAFYAEMLLSSLPAALATGEWVTAAGDGRIAYVARADCAEAAAGALRAGPAAAGRIDVTGPQALNAEEVVRIVNGLFGTALVVRHVDATGLEERLRESGLPPGLAAALVRLDTGVAQGGMALCGDGVERLAVRPPVDVATFLSAHRDALRLALPRGAR